MDAWAGLEGQASTRLGDGMVRLLMRMLLLYIQQAPINHANQSVLQAAHLLPSLVGTACDPLNR